jgi:hypothetical protein
VKGEGRHAQLRLEFRPGRGRTYVPSDLRAAVRRAEAWRADREARGLEPPAAESYAAGVLRRGRAAGLLGRGGRMMAVMVNVDPELVEHALRFAGARSLQELVLVALVSVILKGRGASPRFADRRPPRPPRRRRQGRR